MELTQEPLIRVQARAYRLEMMEDRPAARLYDAGGRLMAELFLLFSAHTLTGRDVSGTISPWQITRREGEIVLRATLDSNVWAQKTVTLRLTEDRIMYLPQVRGEGELADVEYFSGYYTGSNARRGNARFYSAFYGDALFNPEPDRRETYFRPLTERSLIDLMGVPLPGRDGWFFTPPPFCFVLCGGDSCMTLGAAADPGAHTFTEMEYTGGGGQGIVLRYEGYTRVRGDVTLPALHMIFGSDPYELLGKFSPLERLPAPSRPAASWWTRPVFCGWGAQSALSREMGKSAPELANQAFYERFAASLDEKGIDPGILVIDDKWQRAYGVNDVDAEKWPDMKGFIAAMHEKGRRVLLWLKAWDPEGVEERLCIRDFRGVKQAIDPEHPDYRALFQAACRQMLSPEGLNADGFKIDFTARIPSCPGCHGYGTHWGLELMRDYLAMVYDGAKAVKADALVMCHCPHPYLADKLDMIRLNDVNMDRPVCDQMRHRARVVRAVMPDKLIDTDNWPMPDKRSWLDYVRLQPELGVPSLYYLWHMDNSPEEITDADLDVVRSAWRQWEERRK